MTEKATTRFKSVSDFNEYMKTLPENHPKIITFRSVFKITKMTVQPCMNSFNEWVFDKNWGELITDEQLKAKRAGGDSDSYATPSSRFILEEGASLNLNERRDQLIWGWLQYSPTITVNRDDAYTLRGKDFFIDFPVF